MSLKDKIHQTVSKKKEVPLGALSTIEGVEGDEDWIVDSKDIQERVDNVIKKSHKDNKAKLYQGISSEAKESIEELIDEGKLDIVPIIFYELVDTSLTE